MDSDIINLYKYSQLKYDFFIFTGYKDLTKTKYWILLYNFVLMKMRKVKYKIKILKLNSSNFESLLFQQHKKSI